MAIVIKSLTQIAPAGAKQLYRHALVEKGTLLALDFSNRGTLDESNVGDGAKVYNLARESSDPLNAISSGIIGTVNPLILTAGKGIDPSGLIGNNPQGVFIEGNLGEYLFNKQPKSLVSFWVRRKAGETITATMIGGPVYPAGNITVNLSPTGFAGRFANTSIGGGAVALPVGQVNQVAIEYNGADVPIRIFVNKVLVNTNILGASFVNDEFLVIGRPQSLLPGAALYSLFLEDLTVSGRTTEEVISKEWDYYNGLGEFEGIGKRPFIDSY